ncbi:MAG: protein translocase subunit SecD [Gammaproteobacteria bacterium]|nr:protein translocase subunit SecD [Gammaproteobacteria bacterium]
MNRYPSWANVSILAIVALGILIALPNVFGKGPAVQITAGSGQVIEASKVEEFEAALMAAKIKPTRQYEDQGRLVMHFDNVEQQLAAKEALADTLDKDFIAALTLEPRSPSWLRSLGLRPMNLGLDLRGGVHFLFEVDMDEAIARDMQRYSGDFKKQLRDESLRYRRVIAERDRVVLTFNDIAVRDDALKLLKREVTEIDFASLDDGGQIGIFAQMNEEQLKERRKFAIDQNSTTLRNRVNELGVAEPVVQQQGVDRILVQLPGVQDPAQAERVLGATATLEFRMVSGDDNAAMMAEQTGRPPLGSKLYKNRDGIPMLLNRDVIVTGDNLVDANAGFDADSGTPMVSVRLDSKGAKRMLETTKVNVGNLMAVVFIEQNRETYQVEEPAGSGNFVQRERAVVTEEIINAATIRGVFGANFQITGLDSTAESSDLALLLRAGALATPVYKVEERTIGPSLGQDNIDKGKLAVIIGFVAVVIFMLFYYQVFGLFADLALLGNLVFIVALLSLFQAALTLPGIAGILLTVGMAVDANVLIFERIREELRNGNSPQASIHAGYEKAFSSIADANVTTLIAALVLFFFGTGPIRGFAVTLSLGIITSMFTAIIGTRALVNWIYGGRSVKRLHIGGGITPRSESERASKPTVRNTGRPANI